MKLDPETIEQLGMTGGWDDQTHALLMRASEETVRVREAVRAVRAANPARAAESIARLRACDTPEKTRARKRKEREADPEKAREQNREAQRRRRAKLASLVQSGIRTREECGIDDGASGAKEGAA